MDKKEFVDLVHEISDLFPNFGKGDTPEEQSRFLNNWYKRLKDCDTKKVQKRLDEYISSGNRFAPTIGDLIVIEKADERSGPYVPSYEETMRYLDERDAANQAAENMTEEERAHVRDIQRQIERNLGIVRHQDASNA